MYWNQESVYSSTLLDSLLNAEDVTLQDVMDDEEVLQECKSLNKKLIDFLIRSDILEELVTLTIVEPSTDCDENTRYKYSNMACELLTCEVPQMTEKLAGDKVLLAKLYSFLEVDSPLNPLLASFFSKTFSFLIARKSEQNWYSYQFICLQVLEFLKSKENSLSLLLKHLGTSAIMDLTLKLMTKVEDEHMKQDMLSWLDSQNIIQNIVSLLHPSVDSDRHTNAAQLLCDVVITARENQKRMSEKLEIDPILDRIESPETVTQLLDHILVEPKSETSIVGGISVLLTLLDCDTKDTSDTFTCTSYPATIEETSPTTPEPSKVALSTVAAILPRLKDFHDVLVNPPVKPSVKTSLGVLDPPLGATRVEVARLLSVLVSVNNNEINTELARLDTINTLLDLFFKYSWNNFLHTQVEQCMAFALNNVDLKTGQVVGDGGGSVDSVEDNSLIAHILVKCRLLERILEAWEENNKQETESSGPRRGYMGHLIKISNSIAQVAEKGPLGAFMKNTLPGDVVCRWEEFVNNNLSEVNQIQQICLGGTPPGHSNSDFKEVQFQDEAAQQSFNAYQHQNSLAPTFSRTLGSFDEDQFNDSDDIHNAIVDGEHKGRLFNLTDEEMDQSGILFEQVCNQKLQTLDDDENDMWDSNGAKSLDSQGRYWQEERSSSDEEEVEERTGPDGREEIALALDSNDVGNPVGDVDVAPVVDSNPWSYDFNTVGQLNETDNVQFDADFDFTFPDINTTIATSHGSEAAVAPSLDLTPNGSGNSSDTNVCQELTEAADIDLIVRALDKLITSGDVQPETNISNSCMNVEGETVVENDRLTCSQGVTSSTVGHENIDNNDDSVKFDGEGDGARLQLTRDNNSLVESLPKVPATVVPTDTTTLILNNSVEDNPPDVTKSNGPV